jgi:photosystem II stability/assembly factor-like uncharacterized protein
MHLVRTNKRTSHPYFLILLSALLLSGLSACSTSLAQSGGWQQPDRLPKQPIRSIVTDPNKPQNIYAGTEHGSVLVSTDGGVTWKEKFPASQTEATDPVYAVGFDYDGKKLYTASASNLAVSSDGGQSWQILHSSTLPADQYTALAFNFKDTNTLYVGTAQHGVFKSSDGGQNWQALSQSWPSGTQVNALQYVTGERQLWAATSNGIYREIGDTSAWQAFNTGLPTGAAANAVAPLAFYGGDPKTVLLGTTKGFFISKDNGAHWSPGKDALAATSVLSILVDYRKTSLTTVFVGLNSGVLQSDDQGQTWRGIAPGLPPHAGVAALTLGAANNAQLFVGSDTIYLYPGNGASGGPNYIVIIIFVAFFLALYYIMQRSKRRSLDALHRRMVQHFAQTGAAKKNVLTPLIPDTPAAPPNSRNGHKPEAPSEKTTPGSPEPEE